MSLQEQFDRSLNITRELIRIDSVNPTLVKGAVGEKPIAEFLQRFLRDEGISSELQEVAPGRFNLISSVKGVRPGPRVLLNGHLDTVSVAGMSHPFDPFLKEGKIHGRGSQDMKGGLGAGLAALLAVSNHRDDLCGEVVFAAVADEEGLSLGTTWFLEHWSKESPFDFALVLEPTDFKLCTAHKGFAWVKVTTYGIAAHGSCPAEGVDAIFLMGELIGELNLLDQSLQKRPLHESLGSGSLHTSMIHGGQQWSSYPDYCRLQYERRTVPPETPFTVQAEIQQLLEKCQRKNPQFKAVAELICTRSPFQIDPEQAILQQFYQTAYSHLPEQISWGSVPFWTDAALLANAQIPTLVFGPRGTGLHSCEEYVIASDLSICAEIIYHFLTQT